MTGWSIVNSTEVYEGLNHIYDTSIADVEEKFANSIIHFRQFNDCPVHAGAESQIFKKRSEQSDFQFGFIPLGEQKMPQDFSANTVKT